MTTNTCNEVIETKDGLVVCNAKWRAGYPFGRKAGCRTVMIREHHKKCKFKRRIKRRR